MQVPRCIRQSRLLDFPTPPTIAIPQLQLIVLKFVLRLKFFKTPFVQILSHFDRKKTFKGRELDLFKVCEAR